MAKADEADKYNQWKSLDSTLIAALQSFPMVSVDANSEDSAVYGRSFYQTGFWGDCFVEPLYFIELGRMQGPLDSPVMDSSSALASRMIGKFDWEPGPITHDIMHETMFSTNASIEKRPVPNYTGFGSIRGPTEIVVIAKIPSRTRTSLSGACLIKSWRSILC